MSLVNVRNCIRFYQTAEELSAGTLMNYCAEIIASHWVGERWRAVSKAPSREVRTSVVVAVGLLGLFCFSLAFCPQDDLRKEDFSSMSAQLLYKMIKSKTEYPLHKAIKVEREDVVFLYLIEMDSQVL